MKPIFAFGIATIAVALLSGEPSAYSVTGPKWAQPQMTFRVNQTNQDLPGSTAVAAVRAGADAWFLQSAAFKFIYGGLTSLVTSTNDGVNLVLFRNASSGSAIATAFTWSSGGTILDSDVIFWDQAFTFFAGSTGCSGGFYIEDIAVHEFGHSLGLGHSEVADASMFPSVSHCNMSNRTLDADDIAGVRSIYPLLTLLAPTGLRIVP